jgi:hypothetical protein
MATLAADLGVGRTKQGRAMGLSADEAAGMTVNERLFAAGLLEAFDLAIKTRDETKLRHLLASVYLTKSDIDRIVQAQLA